MLMTRRFLLHVVQVFHDKLNVRELRRDIASHYAANCIAAGASAATLWCLSAVPDARAMRAMVCVALEHFLPAAVARVRSHINCYSGTVLRCDGHWDIAHRIAVRDASGQWTRPFTVLHGICLVDGALADVPTPMRTENMDDILQDLDRVVDNITSDRTRAGFGPLGSAVAVHSTDSYGKQRLRLAAFYRHKYHAVGVRALAPTPRANAEAAEAVGADQEDPTLITGEPCHDSFALNALVSVHANDARDMRYDHKDMLARLSGELAEVDVSVRPEELPAVGHALLQSAVRDASADFAAKLRADDAGRAAVAHFLGQPNVSKARVWKSLFGACPPRAPLPDTLAGQKLGFTPP